MITESDEVFANALQALGRLPSELDAISGPEEARRRIFLAYGWWAQAVRSGEGVRLMYEHGLAHEAHVLVRTVMHLAAALEWARRTPEDALDGIVEEHERRRVALAGFVESWDLNLDVDTSREKQKVPGLEPLLNVKALCAAIEMPDLYAAYRTESAYAHPSLVSAAAYHGSPEGHDLVDVPGKETPLRAPAMFSVLATRSCGEILGDSRLIDAARSWADRAELPAAFWNQADDGSTT